MPRFYLDVLHGREVRHDPEGQDFANLDAARDEAKAAALLRRMSPTAFPNPLMVGLADRLLNRSGRMSAAVAAMGPPVSAFESEPFALSLRG